MPIKKLVTILASLILAFLFLLIINPAYSSADELDDINKQLSKLNDELNKSIAATKPLEGQLESMQKQIASIKQQVVGLESGIVVKKREIDNGYKNLDQKTKLIEQTIRDFYIKSYNDCPLCELFSLENASDVTLSIAYNRAKTNQDKQLIVNLALSITNLEEKKASLEREQKALTAAKVNLDEQSKKLDGIVKGAKNFQGELSGKIAALSAQQTSIIAARSGGSITSVGSVPIGSDFNGSVGFKASAPSGSFAAFAFGAHTHRNGMSQYGAKKHAENKDYKAIIQWYYNSGVKKDDGMPSSIEVQGHGTMDFQTYLYGIAEMPSDWPLEALKAQAVAARTYALKTGKPICTNEGCQVFLKSKSDNPPPAWRQAVDETNKEVIDGNVSAQYSSTTGGYINTSGWDTTDRSNSGEWTSRAYESMAGSPWFYKAWYRNGYSNSSDSCGRSHPWLSEEEMSDLINGWIVRKNPNGAETNRIIPVTIAQCPIRGVSGNPYSMSELRERANNSGGAVTSISSVTTSNNGSGQTTNVSFQTNKGNINMSGSEFKETFNVRAPGYISIPQTGFAFFNIEKK